jgi:hypothetical protein
LTRRGKESFVGHVGKVCSVAVVVGHPEFEDGRDEDGFESH